MKRIHLFMLLSLLLSWSCSAMDTVNPNAKAARTAIEHYFTAPARISDSQHPSFVIGDFNGDGVMDMAVLFHPAQTVTTSKQVRQSSPWDFPGSVLAGTFQTSLAIFNGNRGGWLSPDAKVFVLLDKTGTLETPSFKLTATRKTDKDYARLVALLPGKRAGDLIVLPTEAGIDTIVYWEKDQYKLYIPMETP